jgi:predicted ATPase
MPALLSDEERETLQRQVGGATRDRMLREMAEALEVLTVERPLILCLEDLHWSDYSTLELLSVVTSRPEPARLFVLGTCRPLEVLGSDHPLKNLRVQIQRSDRYHELTPSSLSPEAVGQYLAQRFVDRALPAGVAQVVHHHAEGNPLFMVNVADYLEQQGVFDDESGDRVRQILDGATIGIPESLRQLIEHHIEKMSVDEQDVLMAASVAGMEFSAAAVAAGVREEDEAVEVRCANLARRSQFLHEMGVAQWPDGTLVSRYRFIHAFYQNVLYERVPLGRRASLHLRIGDRLERAYPSRRDEVASELAVHFEHGRDFRRAVQYVGQAAQSAMWTYAYREAIDHLSKGVKLLTQLPESPEREQQELALQVGLSLSLMHTRGFAAPEVERAYDRIRDLCKTAGDSLQRFAALWGLRNFHLLRGEPQAGRAAAQEFLEQVQRTQMSSLAAEAHVGLGTPLFQLGEFEAARPHLEQSLRLYNPQLPQPKVLLTGQDPRASSLAHLAVLLWITGYPDQAREHSRQALTLAQDTIFPYGRALASNLAATLHVCFRDFKAVAQHAETAQRFAQECGYVHLMAMGMVLQGWASVMQGKGDEGIALMKTGLQRQQAAGVRIGEVSYRLLLADAYSKTGQGESALQALTDAVAAIERTGEGTFEPELYRLQGELALRQPRTSLGQISDKSQASRKQSRTSLGKVKASQDKSEDTDHRGEAEACFLKAIDIARRQQAKSLELRATLSLARLWQQQGKQHAAYSMLSEVYSWFSEGFDTPDLQEAKILLTELQRVG